jgi:hypothetical protein
MRIGRITEKARDLPKKIPLWTLLVGIGEEFPHLGLTDVASFKHPKAPSSPEPCEIPQGRMSVEK